MTQSPGRGAAGRSPSARGVRHQAVGWARLTHFACAGRRARYSLFRPFPPNALGPSYQRSPPVFLRSAPLRFLLACLIALAPSLAFAQSQATTGVIEGTVSDPSGAAVPGASVSIKNTATNLERSLITDADGRFRGVAPAARPVPGHRHPQGLRDPGARGHRARPSGQSVEPGPHPQGLERPGGDRGHGRGAGDRDDPDGGRRPHQPGGGPGAAQQRPQLPRLHEAHAGRDHRPGPRRRRADRSTARRASTTTSRWTAPTSTTRSSASSAAASARPSPSTSTPSRRWWSWPTGANAEFGRSSGGFVNVVTKSGTNDIHGTAARLLQGRHPGLGAQERGRLRGRQVRLRPAAVRLHARRAHQARTSSSTSSPSTTRTATRPSRPTRRASSRASSTTSRASGARTRTARSSGPTTRGSSSPSSTGT